ncbi:MAG: trypsin-like peptidase domain-containing protein, partial [Aliidongia sp.]
MKHSLPVLLLSLMLLPAPTDAAEGRAVPTSQAQIQLSFAPVVRRAAPAVVNILTKVEPDTAAGLRRDPAYPGYPGGDEEPSAHSLGSGVIVDPNGTIITNHHVIDSADMITVVLSDRREFVATVLRTDDRTDLAVLKINPGEALPYLEIRDSDELEVGDIVLAIGNPFGVGQTVTSGIVSALARNVSGINAYRTFIQTDAAINHGNSGGPLFDMRGEVVGVDSDIISPTLGAVGLGFAIPSSTAEFVIDRLRTFGWIKAGWIGVKVQPVTQQIADAMGWTHPQGSIVSWVLADGPAKKAGLEIGDVILRYDGRTPEDDRALLRDIVATPVGQVVTMTIERDGKDLNLPIKIDAWPRDQWEAKDAPLAVQRPK